jgi:hypothetical protein
MNLLSSQGEQTHLHGTPQHIRVYPLLWGYCGVTVDGPMLRYFVECVLINSTTVSCLHSNRCDDPNSRTL